MSLSTPNHFRSPTAQETNSLHSTPCYKCGLFHTMFVSDMYVLLLYFIGTTLSLAISKPQPHLFRFPAYRFYPQLFKRNFILTKKSSPPSLVLKDLKNTGLEEDGGPRRGTFWSKRSETSRNSFFSTIRKNQEKKKSLPFSSIIRIK